MDIERSILTDKDILLCRGINRFLLLDYEQRELLAWFVKNRPELIGEVICLQHCQIVSDYNNYCENKAERRK